MLSSTIIVSLKVHIPPDDTFSAERKTCYLLGKYGIRFVCNISCICVNTDRILEKKMALFGGIFAAFVEMLAVFDIGVQSDRVICRKGSCGNLWPTFKVQF